MSGSRIEPLAGAVVRRARRGDETAVRAVRLEALADSPHDFDSSLEAETAWDAEAWTQWIERGATFLLEVSGRPRGIAAGVPDREDPLAAFLVAVWVHPHLRGRGGADRLVAAVLAWAREGGASRVLLHVDKRNQRARRFYARSGFRPTGREVLRDRDGLPEVELQTSGDPGVVRRIAVDRTPHPRRSN